MAYNVMQEYINIVKKEIYECMKLMLEKHYNKAITDKYIQKYVDVRYNNFTHKNDERTLKERVVKSLETVKKEIDRQSRKIGQVNELTYKFFSYILYFDKVLACKDYKDRIQKIEKAKLKAIDKSSENFKEELYNCIIEYDRQKEKFLEKFDSKDFELEMHKYPGINEVYKIDLKYNIKFPMIYSEKAIEKAFATGITNEDKLLVEYYKTAALVLNDIIKHKMKRQYVVEFEETLFEKNKKMKGLLEIINSCAIQEKINLRIRYEVFLKNKDKVYELMRNGFKIAIILDNSFKVNFKNMEILNLFSYIIISKQLNKYEEIIQNKVMLKNIIEI